MPHQSKSNAFEAGAECRGCGTTIPHNEAILVKFHRCFYCGQHDPLGMSWTRTTAPVVIAALIGLIAIWWTQIPS